MIVIYAEKYSLAKEIANALNAGNRIPYDKDNRICHWEFEFNGDLRLSNQVQHFDKNSQ